MQKNQHSTRAIELYLKKSNNCEELVKLYQEYKDESDQVKKNTLYKAMQNFLRKRSRDNFSKNISKYDEKVQSLLTGPKEISNITRKYINLYFVETDTEIKYKLYNSIMVSMSMKEVKYEYTPVHHICAELKKYQYILDSSGILPEDIKSCGEYFRIHIAEFKCGPESKNFIPFKTICKHVYNVILSEKILEDIRTLYE